MSDKTIQVRDHRNSNYFTIDNAILDSYQEVGPFGILAYMVICRHVNNGSQKCRLTIDLIAKKSRVSRSSICRGLAELEKAGVLQIDRTPKESSTFTLLAVKSNSSSFPIETVEGAPFLSDMPSFLSESHNKTILYKTKTNTYPEADASGVLVVETLPLLEVGFELEPPEKRPDFLDDVIRKEIFPYYLSKCDRHPGLYELTPKRLKVAHQRFDEAMKKVNGKVDNAKQLMLAAIDAVAENPWNMGKNPQGKKYNDWIDHIFRSKERFQELIA